LSAGLLLRLRSAGDTIPICREIEHATRAAEKRAREHSSSSTTAPQAQSSFVLEVQAHSSTLTGAGLAANGWIYAYAKRSSPWPELPSAAWSLGHWSFSPMALLSLREQCQGMTTSNDKQPIVPPYIFAPFYSPWLMPPSRVPEGPGLMLRARVWRRRLDLDAALAGGTDPIRSEELELRAEQLADRKTRNELATEITRLIRIADGHGRRPLRAPGPPFRPAQVRANRALLAELAARLLGPRSVALPGMALTSLLLKGGRGPLTTDSDPLILERAVRATLASLNEDPHPRHAAQLPVGTSS
jgi:hypothetical protein